MLLPAQIQGHQFQMSRGTYKSVEVDAFMNEIYTSYDQMFRENGELIKKLELLAAKVEEYRKDEDNIRIALLTAQRMADQITREARESAESMQQKAKEQVELVETNLQQKATRLMSEAEQTATSTVQKANTVAQSTLAQAKLESERILGGVKREVVTEQAALDQMKKEVSEFRSKLMSMYKEHIERVNDMPSFVEIPQEEMKQPVEAAEPQTQETLPIVQPDAQSDAAVLAEVELVEEPQAEAAEVYTEQGQAETEPQPEVSLRDMVNAAYAEVEQTKPQTEEKPEYKAKSGGFQVRMDHLEEADAARSDTHILPKFQDLKFGEDYDISADADEDEDAKLRKGFFRKK